MNERICKGIFIPIEIWKNKDLTWNEKILFVEIDSFTSKDRDCFISNEYIAELLQVTETTANKVLSSLIKKGYVIKTSFDGRRRFVKTAFSFEKYQESKQGCSDEQGRLVFDDNIPNTSNNTIIKEDKDKSLSKKSDTIDYFMLKEEWEKTNPNLSSIRDVSEKRKRSIKTLLKNNNANVEDLIRAFKIVSICSFLQGKNNRNWKASFDWLINDTKSCFNRVLEGEYCKGNEELAHYSAIVNGLDLKDMSSKENSNNSKWQY